MYYGGGDDHPTSPDEQRSRRRSRVDSAESFHNRRTRRLPSEDIDQEQRSVKRRRDERDGSHSPRRPRWEDRRPPPNRFYPPKRRQEEEPRAASPRRESVASVDRPRVTEEDRKKKEVEDARREDLTVLVVNLALKATEKDIWQFFTRHAGKVRDIQLIKDARSGKSKGIGYVEFHDAESVLKSLNLTGQCILNQPIRVQASQGEKNRAAKAAKLQQAEIAAQGPTRLYVGGLSESLIDISTEDLRSLFAPFGGITYVEIPKDPYTGRSRGYAFLQFKQAGDARDAVTAMHGFPLAGKELKVGFAGDEQPRTTSTASTVDVAGGGVSAHWSSQPGGLDLDRIADDHDDRLLHGGAVMRLALSQKLQQKSNDPIPLFSSTAAQFLVSGTNGMDTVAAQLQSAMGPVGPTAFLCLGNMFTRQEVEESGPQLLQEVKDDVRQECGRFGEVVELWLDDQSLDGKVYLHFAEVDGARQAQRALHGRSYGGTAVSAAYIDEPTFRQIVS